MKYYLLSLLWLFCITTSAHAGTVAFQISASSTFSETETILNFTFKNLGNDTANKFSAKVIQGEKTFTSEVIEGIAPSMEYKITLKVDSSAYKDKGAYTEAVYISYIDGAGYKYSIPSVFKIVNDKEDVATITLKVTDVDYSLTNSTELTIINNSNIEKNVTLNASNPMSFKLKFLGIENEKLTLAPNETKNVKIEIKSKSELANAWQSFIRADYIENNVHYTASTTLTINSAKENKISDFYKGDNIYIGLGIMLGLNIIYLGYQFYHRKNLPSAT